MAQTVEINGEVYSDVPSIEVPLSTSGTASFYDISDTTAGAEDVAAGKYFYNSSGTRTAGTGSYVTDVEMYGSSVVTGGVAEIPDTIHVGASAPSDPNVKIWLDTDETSTPVVTSVNGATGSITAVNSIDGQSGAVTTNPILSLLWTNTSETSVFAAQTLSIDTTSYTALIIKVRRSNGSTYYMSNIVLVDGTDSIVFGGGGGANTSLPYRVVNAISSTTDSITFSIGYLQGNSGTSSEWAIPTKIYGIRGTII